MVRHALAAALAAMVVGVAACDVATLPAPEIVSNSPGARGGSASTPTASVAATPSPAPASTRPPEPEPLALDIGIVDRGWTDPFADFASDGASVIFSSGVAGGPGAEYAPDLWRYVPGAAGPELLWRNPRRDWSLVVIGGDRDVWAFVEMPMDNSRAWSLWLLTEPGGEPILLDTHPGDEAVTSWVPSFEVRQEQVVWSAFDAGSSGPVSQLLYATPPDWEPRLALERPADEAELWFPSLWGPRLAYTEVPYENGATDEHGVFLMDLGRPAEEPMRLDTSGRATMPVLVDDGVVWKTTDPGFSMFNWGRLFHYDLSSGEASPLSMEPQEYVNYPSGGSRFVAASSADAFTFTVHDLERRQSRVIAELDHRTNESVPQAHVSGDLLVWLHSTIDDSPVAGHNELRYAFLPMAGEDRLP